MASPFTITADAQLSTDFANLQSVVTKTKAAIEAGDFAKAQTEFEPYETYWRPVEDGVKAKSSTVYDAIETSAEQVLGEIKSAQPSKTKALTAVQSLSDNVASAAKL